MAKSKSTFFLGYEDEEITAKHEVYLNSFVNKIGGTPDWPSGDIIVPNCPMCNTVRPLIVQMYAPLEQSKFHRSLYIFACLNPACSQISKSWLCIRIQNLDIPNHAKVMSATKSPTIIKKKKNTNMQIMKTQKMRWCSGVDDWGDSTDIRVLEEMDTEADDFQQQNEKNGNVVEKRDELDLDSFAFEGGSFEVALSHTSDDESNSMENDLTIELEQLNMQSPQNSAAVEDPNANCAAGIVGAIVDGDTINVASSTPTIFAEIEGTETDLVLVETPKEPERDLIALLKHTPSSVVVGPLTKITDVTLKSFFIAVDIEQRQYDFENYEGALSANHIRELYNDYNITNSAYDSSSAEGIVSAAVGIGGVNVAGSADEQEPYEKALPAHGDIVFHHFISTIQQNPGQLLRYSRNAHPLLIAPLCQHVPKCQHCNGDTICEVQVLSTLIPKLRLQQNGEVAPIEYGNVLVFTCLKSCWDTPDKMRYEHIIVQSEK